MKIFAVGFAALVLAASAQAQDAPLEVGLHLVSVHDTGGYQNDNPGIYVRYDGWTAGVFQNSVNKTSVYGAYTWEWKTPQLPVVDSVAITWGLATGYPQKIGNTELSALFVPSAAFDVSKEVRLRVAYVPAFQQYVRATAIHFMLEKTF
jgi:hypothetical protein